MLWHNGYHTIPKGVPDDHRVTLRVGETEPAAKYFGHWLEDELSHALLSNPPDHSLLFAARGHRRRPRSSRTSLLTHAFYQLWPFVRGQGLGLCGTENCYRNRLLRVQLAGALRVAFVYRTVLVPAILVTASFGMGVAADLSQEIRGVPAIYCHRCIEPRLCRSVDRSAGAWDDWILAVPNIHVTTLVGSWVFPYLPSQDGTSRHSWLSLRLPWSHRYRRSYLSAANGTPTVTLRWGNLTRKRLLRAVGIWNRLVDFIEATFKAWSALVAKWPDVSPHSQTTRGD